MTYEYDIGDIITYANKKWFIVFRTTHLNKPLYTIALLDSTVSEISLKELQSNGWQDLNNKVYYDRTAKIIMPLFDLAQQERVYKSAYACSLMNYYLLGNMSDTVLIKFSDALLDENIKGFMYHIVSSTSVKVYSLIQKNVMTFFLEDYYEDTVFNIINMVTTELPSGLTTL